MFNKKMFIPAVTDGIAVAPANSLFPICIFLILKTPVFMDQLKYVPGTNYEGLDRVY